MELRTLTWDDRAAHRRLMSEAFSGGRRPSDEEPSEGDRRRFEASLHLGVFDGTRLVAAATVHDLPVAWGEHDLRMGGMAGVACAADQRGRGHVGRLLAESLRRMREAGQPVSGLYPFSFAFYRRQGWEWVGEKREFTVPTSAVPSDPERRQVQMFEGTDALDLVKPIHAEYARRYRGMTTRENVSPDWWSERLGVHNGRTTYVHVHREAATGWPDGYLTYRYPDGGGAARVGDFCALTPSAYQGLLSVIHYYGTQVETVAWAAPVDDPLPLYVMHWDLKTEVRPLFMGRVVDVRAALETLRPAPNVVGQITLRVSDPQADWNDGAFAVAVQDGRVTVSPTDTEADVALDIQALSQAYWGQPDLSRLHQAGRVTVTDPASLHLLDALLPPAVCFLPDFF